MSKFSFSIQSKEYFMVFFECIYDNQCMQVISNLGKKERTKMKKEITQTSEKIILASLHDCL